MREGKKFLPALFFYPETRQKNFFFFFISAIGTAEIPELPDKGQLILVYCRSGNRSKQASEKLVRLGYTNIVEFGGINDWPGETVSGNE